ncbi:MAG TPA: hypothetical protein VIK61_18275 [Acidimicrobiia bacterium]
MTDRDAAPGGRASPEPCSDAAIPRWFAIVLTAALAVVSGFGLVGLVLAVVGAFVPVLVVPLGALAALLLFRAAGGGPANAAGSPSSAPPAQTDQWTASGAVALAVGFAVTSTHFAAQHVLIDRDPGAYVNTGRWLATHSGLTFRADIGAFRGTSGLAYSSPAIDGHGPAMHFQFAHLLGVLLAEARWLGGDRAMFALVPLLGALAIAGFYAIARRFVRPVIALAATAALACNVVQLHFARDAYSEILLQFVLFGSVWLLSEPGLDRGRAAFAGVLLGATVAARIDGPLYLSALPVVIAIAVRRRTLAIENGADVRDPARFVGAFVAGVAAVVVLAAVDVVWRSPEYAGQHGARLIVEYFALVGIAVVAALLASRVPRRRSWWVTVPWLPSAVGAAGAAALVVGWLVRPYVQHVRGTAIPLVALLQHVDGLAPDPTRQYYESSLRWLAWYLGPPALATGIVGAALLVRATLRRGTDFEWVLTTAFAATGAVYLWNANALPDQLWVMRRFVPMVLPGFVLCAALALEWLATRPGRRGRITAAVLGVAIVAWPISATAAVPRETTQAHLARALTATCRALGPNAAVVVLHGANSFDEIVPQAIRGFCGVPVAIRRPAMTATDLESLARRVRAEGRTLVLLADTPAHITAIVPDARPRAVATVVETHELEQTLTKPARHYWSKTYSFAVGVVPLTARSPLAP